MLSEKRDSFKSFEKIIGRIFSGFLSPNQYTLISLFFALLCLFHLSKERLSWALAFFSIAAFLDFVDGAVARENNLANKKGAYLDTICDRYVEGIIWLGFLFLPLPKVFLPASIWIFLAFLGSLLTTYSKAAAREKGLVEKELQRGFIGRGERMILTFLIILVGIFNLNWTLYLIMVLAVLTNLTALQRVYLALK